MRFLSRLVRYTIDSNNFTTGKWNTFGTSSCMDLCDEIQNRNLYFTTYGASRASWDNFMKLYDWIDSEERTSSDVIQLQTSNMG